MLVALSVVEQRLDAVRAVLAGATVVEVAEQVGVSRQSVHTWLSRYLAEGVAGLADRSHRPSRRPQQVPDAVESRVAEMRREHPRWGANRIRLELLRSSESGGGGGGGELEAGLVPSRATINRILTRRGLLTPRPRKRPRDSYQRFERPGPMQLWGIDIVGGIQLVNPGTGELREAKIVTGVDDHSRYCVIAHVVERATGRVVCLAFAQALARFGIPEEVITDNGKQFTARFGHGGEVLFDKICRRNGITHRLTAPASPNQNGKVERFHGTFRPEIEEAGPFESVQAAQAAVDEWVAGYNTNRPHQGLDDKTPVMPDDRFAPTPEHERELVDLWLPPTITPTPAVTPADGRPAIASTASKISSWDGGAVEFDRTVPPSGNLTVSGKQFWLGPARAGQTVSFWADCDRIHLRYAGVRVKTVRSHLSANDLRKLTVQGAVPAGPSPLPPVDDSNAIEIDRTVSKDGNVSVAGRQILAAEILAGRRVSIRIEPQVLMFFDPDTRELLRTRPNQLPADRVNAIRDARPAGQPPRPATEPIRVQRRAWSNGGILVAGQRVMLGRDRAGQTVTVLVSETTLAIEFDDGEPLTVRRTTSQPVRRIKAQRPRTATPIS